MLVVKYLLMIAGAGLLAGSAVLLIYDLYRLYRLRQENEVRWKQGARMVLIGLVPLLLGLSIALVPGGSAGVVVSQASGVLPGTLYPGVHWIMPLVDRVELYSIRDNLYTTALGDPKKREDGLRVQTREGLSVGLAISVRYRLDPSKLSYIHANLPQPVEQEMVPPVVSSAFREIAPNYLVRELFATKRGELRQAAAGTITKKLAADGIVVKEVMLRDLLLPAEYAKGLEGLLLKEQENERLGVDLEVKQKEVKAAELEAEAQKAREVKAAEGRAQIVVLEAKAQADAMQHTLPLKEKQIQQTRLEAEARKESTVKNAEALAQSKTIDSKAELDRLKLMAEAEDYRIRRVSGANAEKMKLEADVLKQNPMLIQKIIAEKLSDKVQIMMVPNDGKFFFANDVLRGLSATAPQQ